MNERNDLPDDAIDLLRRFRTACPDLEALAIRARETRSGEVPDPVRSHVERCLHCQETLRILAELHSALEGQDSIDAPGWEEARPLLRERVVSMAAKGTPPRDGQSLFSVSLGRIIWRPAFAYICVLALIYPAYLGIFARREKQAAAEPGRTSSAAAAGATMIVALEPSDLRGGRDGPIQITLNPSCPFITFRFFVPVRRDSQVRYSAAIRGDSGNLFSFDDLTSVDEVGNFALVCPSAKLAPGSYVLTVEERQRGADRRFSEHLFPFAVKK